MNFIDKALAEPSLNFYSVEFTEKDFTNQCGCYYANKIIDFPVVHTPIGGQHHSQGSAMFLFDGVPQRYTVLSCEARPDGKYSLSIVI